MSGSHLPPPEPKPGVSNGQAIGHIAITRLAGMPLEKAKARLDDLVARGDLHGVSEKIVEAEFQHQWGRK